MLQMMNYKDNMMSGADRTYLTDTQVKKTVIAGDASCLGPVWFNKEVWKFTLYLFTFALINPFLEINK